MANQAAVSRPLLGPEGASVDRRTYVEPKCCDVIGCRMPAEWERDSAADSDLHDYLCGPHHDLLGAYSTHAAGGYVRLTDPEPPRPKDAFGGGASLYAAPTRSLARRAASPVRLGRLPDPVA